MKRIFNIKQVVFYGWMGLAYLFLWVIHDTSTFQIGFFQAVLNNAWRAVYIIVINFVFFEYVLGYVIKKRRWLVFNIIPGLVMLFCFMVFWSYGLYSWRTLGVSLHIYEPLGEQQRVKALVASQMSFSAGSVFFFAIIRHTWKYIQLQRLEQQLRIEKQAAELNYLRAQTNPHFLFNTLNNIYALSKDKSDLAPESILRLSKILRFMLYETAGDYISTEQELKIIADYIALEKLRYDDSLHVNFNYDVEDLKQPLPPLLLMPLVENAFKHGVSETRGKPFVDIHLSIKDRNLVFLVKNSSERAGEETVKENIGLSNLRRQLELLYTDYTLTVKQENSIFITTLKINLATHV